MIEVISFDGTSLNDATYSAGLPGEGDAFGGNVSATVLDVVGGYQRYEGADVQGVEFTLEVNVLDPTKANVQALSQLFRKGHEAELKIEWDSVEMVRDAAVMSVHPMSGSVNVFVVVLYSADPRWHTPNAETETASLTATGQTVTVNNPGNAIEDRAIIRFTPTTNKAASAAQRFRRYVVAVNRSKRALLDWPIDITNYLSTGPSGGLDHATLTTTKSQTDARDVRVLVDGREVPRFLGEHANTAADSTRMTIWITVPWSAMQEAHLRTAITDSVPANGGEIEVEQDDVRTWPKSGYFLTADGEVIAYSGWVRQNDDGYSAFTGIRRAQWGTAAAASSAGDQLLRAEHKIEIVYGQTSNIDAPDARLDAKPMLDLASNTLSNLRHEWIDFYDDRPGYEGRPGQWRRVLEPRDTQAGFIWLPTSPTAVAGSLLFSYRWDDIATGLNNYNVVRRAIPVGTNGLDDQIEFTRAVEQSVALYLFGVAADGVEVTLDRFGGILSSGAYDSDYLGKLYEVGIYARSQVIASTPEIPGFHLNSVTGLSRNINAVNSAGSIQQPLVNEVDEPGWIDDILLLLSQGTPEVNVTTTLRPDDGSGAIDGSETVQNGSILGSEIGAAAAWLSIGFNLPMPWLPGTIYWIDASVGAGTHAATVWYAQPIEHGGVWPMHGFRVIGDGPIAETARGEDGDEGSVDAVGIDLDPDAVPSFSMSAELDCYEFNGTIVNETTEQEVRFKLYVTTADEIEVDIGNRTVRNLTTGEDGLLYGIFPGDDEAWLSLVPGDNALRVDEVGLAGMDVEVEYYGRWE